MPADYLLSHVAVYLVARRDEQILLLRRYNTGWKDGMYTLPAGHVDDGETVAAAMAREAKEEADIIIPEDALAFAHVMQRKSNDRREYIDFFFEARTWQGMPQNNEPDKCDHLDWFDVNALPPNMIEHVTVALGHIAEGKPFSSYAFP